MECPAFLWLRPQPQLPGQTGEAPSRRSSATAASCLRRVAQQDMLPVTVLGKLKAACPVGLDPNPRTLRNPAGCLHETRHPAEPAAFQVASCLGTDAAALAWIWGSWRKWLHWGLHRTEGRRPPALPVTLLPVLAAIRLDCRRSPGHQLFRAHRLGGHPGPEQRLSLAAPLPSSPLPHLLP